MVYLEKAKIYKDVIHNSICTTRIANAIVDKSAFLNEDGEQITEIELKLLHDSYYIFLCEAKDGQTIPEMTEAIVNSITDRYIELYEKVTGEKFTKVENTNIVERIEKNVIAFL